MPADQLSAIIEELYALDPAAFIPARAEHIKRAKKAGYKDLAAEIGKLRKPTLVAWAVNLASRELTSELTGLLKLGDALRDAQRHLSGTQLRALTSQRQQVVGALAKRTAELAADNGHELNETAVREINQTLHAALADPEIGEKVKTGTLLAAATYSGFGPAGLAAVPPEGKKTEPADETEPRSRKELEEALAALDKQREETDAAREASAAARTQVAEIDDKIAELREELDRAEQERQFARSAEKSPAEARRKAERDLEEAERRVEDAEDALN